MDDRHPSESSSSESEYEDAELDSNIDESSVQNIPNDDGAPAAAHDQDLDALNVNFPVVEFGEPMELVIPGVEPEQERDDDISDSLSTESAEDEEETPGREITFDPNVAGTHSYLGTDLEQVSGRTVLDEGSELSLLVFEDPSIVLMPGQTLPLLVRRPAVIEMLRNVVEQQKTIAVINISKVMSNDYTRIVSKLAPVGTTAQVLSISMVDEDAEDGPPTVKAITIGRQRFSVISSSRLLAGIYSAKVKILPDVDLGDPFLGVIPDSHYRPRATCPADHHGRKPVRVHNSCCYFTPWPYWVYKPYLYEELKGLLKLELRTWGNIDMDSFSDTMSADQLSYWIAANLPVSNSVKLKLLQIDSSIQRLRYELQLVSQFVSLVCYGCKSMIAKRSDVFSLSYEGPMGAYVNPHGTIHEILTVHYTKNLVKIGTASSEFSWFPGYAWTIVNCKICGAHQGWKFTATSPKLKPNSFYGLRRNTVIPDTRKFDEKLASSCCPQL